MNDFQNCVGWDPICESAAETAKALDRAWLAAHPHRKIYARRMVEDEFGVLVAEDGAEVLVIVSQIEPGMRTRKIHAVRSNHIRRVLQMSEDELRREAKRKSRPFYAIGPGCTVDGRTLGLRGDQI